MSNYNATRRTVAESRRAEKAAVSTLLNLLLANEEKVREAAKNDDSRLWLSEDVKVLTHLGVSLPPILPVGSYLFR